jgi:hypothetical protein
LQGVAGPTVIIPAGEDSFEYPLDLPPWMELGRTSRTNLMLTGELADAAGQRHKVCFSTQEQNEQLIALVSPAPLRISVERALYTIQRGGELALPVQIHRDRALEQGCKLELIVPAHMRDVAASAVEIGAEVESGELHLRFGPHPGPFNMPLIIRATTVDRAGEPLVAETTVELR